jgi:ABC-type Mn2+/Zn2+ transport system ATPase subunit
MHDACAHCGHHHELVVRDLRVSYREVLALDGISLATSCGTRVALVGPNGAGKSTLIRAIAGLVRVDAGSVKWRGTEVSRWSREIAYLPQRENVDWSFPITVEGVVRMGRYPQAGWWRLFSRRDREAVDAALRLMDIDDLRDRQISRLSGGQQQRVFLARAIAQEAHVLLLDEPFTGLDQSSKDKLSELLHRLAHEGRLVIASHHELGTVGNLYDEVLLLNRGQICYGPVAEVFTPDNLRLAYGGAEGKEVA